MTIIDVTRNRRNLKMVQMEVNRFALRIQVRESEDIDSQLKIIKTDAISNYFGFQQFEREVKNPKLPAF